MPKSSKWFISFSFPHQNPLNSLYWMNQVIFDEAPNSSSDGEIVTNE